MNQKPEKQTKRSFQSPKGTRDFYPQEMLRRRYIVDAWRRVALRHGFEEIDGPTFEHLDLYTVKSGEGIISELFSFQRAGGEDVYALRPEFTPTLARMYAARARQLPQPTKWFCVSNFFRAERPQRGRLREFFQWNCDVIAGEDAEDGDVEVIHAAIAVMSDCGLDASVVSAHLNDRRVLTAWAAQNGIDPSRHDEFLRIVDVRAKNPAECDARLRAMSIDPGAFGALLASPTDSADISDSSSLRSVLAARRRLSGAGLDEWATIDLSLARGLAYYTGMVFEVIAQGERAVAGGGRYDNLIELFGGPPTPACGFGMGDVVLANLLEDRGLMPEGRELLEALSRPMPLRPDVFSTGKDGADEQVVPLVARLRRGEEAEGWRERGVRPWGAGRYSVPPLHARRSYKQTKNIGKLLGDAGACHARFCVIIENSERCTLKDLDRGEQSEGVALAEVGARVSAAR